MNETVILCIIDGYGIGESSDANACFLANTPCLDKLASDAASCKLIASGTLVGLPAGQMGNSEVGHMSIGSGRIIWQDLPKINQAISTDELKNNPNLNIFINQLKTSKGICHLMGMFSAGGVHSHASHLIYLAKIIADQQIKVCLHLFADGRDNMPGSFLTDIKALLDEIKAYPLIAISTISGRYYAMDRDNRWDRTELCYKAIVVAEGQGETDAITAIQRSYEQGLMDEFMLPIIIGDFNGMKRGDGLLVSNFRADRIRQLLASLVVLDFTNFERKAMIHFAGKLGLVEYGEQISKEMKAMMPSEVVERTLGQVIAGSGFKQLRIAETEKYAHVTFFFNAGIERPLPGEDRILVSSPKVATYDLAPEMSACELTDKLIAAILTKKYALIVVNFANCDMVGHTGNLTATVKAVETIDQCLVKILEASHQVSATLLVTADHGNAEAMHDAISNQPITSHSLNPVPLYIYGPGRDKNTMQLRDGGLADIAPTILHIMKLSQPDQMTGKTLIVRNNN